MFEENNDLYIIILSALSAIYDISNIISGAYYTNENDRMLKQAFVVIQSVFYLNSMMLLSVVFGLDNLIKLVLPQNS